MKLVIIESPFARDPEEMVKYGRKCIRDSVLRGEAPIASHLLFTQPGILDDTDKVERQIGINAGHAWLPAANLVAVYNDYGVSEGMKLGIERAKKAGKQIAYRSIGGLDTEDEDRFANTIPADEAEAWESDERDRIIRELEVLSVRQEWTGWSAAILWIAQKIAINRF